MSKCACSFLVVWQIEHRDSLITRACNRYETPGRTWLSAEYVAALEGKFNVGVSFELCRQCLQATVKREVLIEEETSRLW